MTCKDCLHSRVCFDCNGETRYYGPDVAANNVEILCPCFADRSRYVVREKGEWEVGDYYDCGDVCSCCGWDSALVPCEYNFCPNCGADMRKAENG